jgi:AAA ATPase domain
LQAAAARGLTRFVGRDEEVEQPRRALELAREGRGQVVAVVGEPGVGKSRLFYEFTRSHRIRDWLILDSTSVSYGKATSYLPVIDLLASLLQDREQGRSSHRRWRSERGTGSPGPPPPTLRNPVKPSGPSTRRNSPVSRSRAMTHGIHAAREGEK